MSKLELSISVIAATGSILSGIIMVATFIQVLTRLKFNKEVIYGGEAEERFNKIQYSKLTDGIEIPAYKYDGGKNKIAPRLEFEKCHYNKITMSTSLKGFKKRIRYFYKEINESEEIIMVRTWYLK